MPSRGEAAINDNVIELAEARRRRDQSNEPWVRKEVAAEFFDVKPRTIYRWVRRGCPAKRLPGGTLRFQLGPMREWVEHG